MLNSRQRAQLRGMANGYDTILHIGKGGITDTVIKQAQEALTSRELIKACVRYDFKAGGGYDSG